MNTPSNVLRGTVDAWTAQDADAFAALYSPDATVVLAGGAFLRGREEIRSYMTSGFAGRLKDTRGVDEVELSRVAGDTAVIVSRSGYLLPGQDTVTPDHLRRATWTLARRDGEWVIEAYHNCAMIDG